MTELTIINNGLKKYQYENRDDITRVTIKGETEIPECCFCGCKNLVSVILDEHVRKIGFDAFKDCESLERVVYEGSNSISIYPGAFEGCISLTEVEFLEYADEIDSCAFQNCKSIRSIMLGKTLKNLYGSAFIGVPFTYFSIDSHNKHYYIKNGFLVEKVKNIKTTTYKALCYIGKAEKVVIPREVSVLSYDCFVLKNCSQNIKEITLPSGMSFLQDQRVDPDEYMLLSESTFLKVMDLVVTRGFYSHERYDVFSQCDNLKYFHVSKGNQSYCAKKGILYSKDGKQLIKFPVAYDSVEFTVPESVRIISDYAFYKCNHCMKINLHKNIEGIGYGAFADSSILSVTAPENEDEKIFLKDNGLYIVQKLSINSPELKYLVFYNRDAEKVNLLKDTNVIREYAFQDCRKIQEAPFKLAYKEGVNPIIFEAAFKGCTSLKKFSFPKGVEFVFDECFENCISLQQIELSDEISTVAQYFLYGVENKIKIVMNIKDDRDFYFADEAYVGFKGEIIFDIRSKGFTARGGVCLFDDAPNSSYKVSGNARKKFKSFNNGLYRRKRGDALSLVRVPKNVKEFTKRDFEKNTKMIEPRAFEWCWDLKMIAVPQTVKTVPEGMICGWENLKVVSFPKGIFLQRYKYDDETDEEILGKREPLTPQNVFSIYDWTSRDDPDYPITIIDGEICVPPT